MKLLLELVHALVALVCAAIVLVTIYWTFSGGYTALVNWSYSSPSNASVANTIVFMMLGTWCAACYGLYTFYKSVR
jgi:hypothetical protein